MRWDVAVAGTWQIRDIFRAIKDANADKSAGDSLQSFDVSPEKV